MSDPLPSEVTRPEDDPPPRELKPGQVLALGAAPVEPVLAPLLLPGTLTLVQGPRGVGLSQVMAGCAVAIASGGSFLGWQAPRPQTVALLAGGETATLLARRIALAQRASGCAAPAGDFLKLVALGPAATQMPNLALRTGQLDFETLCRCADVIMIDDFASLLPLAGLECAEGGEMRHIVGRLRRDGKTLVVAQANGLEARRRADLTGRAMVNGLADVVIELGFPPEHADTDGCHFTLRVRRARHVAGPDRRPFEARLGQQDGSPAWVVTPLGEGRRDVFKEMLACGMPLREAQEALGVPRTSAYRWQREYRRARHIKMWADAGLPEPKEDMPY